MVTYPQIASLSRTDFLKIEPAFPLDLPPEIYSSYLQMIQHILSELIPPHLREEEEDRLFFRELEKLLPLVKYPSALRPLQSFPVAFLTPGQHTEGAGRYICDSLIRWLIPGKQVSLIGMMSMTFRFSAHPTNFFYLTQAMVMLSDLEDVAIAKKNLPHLLREMRINIMAVYQARYVTSLRSMSHHYKSLLFKENLSSLFNEVDETNQSLFDQIQGIFVKISSEEKLDQIQKNISSLLTTRPKIFDRDVFYEIAQYGLLFKDCFSSDRNPRQISRIVAYQYLFKKIIHEKMGKSPSERHLSLKISRSLSKNKEPIVSILLGFNLLRETEQFEGRHLVEAIRACLPYLDPVAGSLIADKRHGEIRFFYLEMSKKEKAPFFPQEMKYLREKLPQEVMRQIETTVHPIFLPRNEEELLRNVIVLSKQIKYVRDLPQVSIHYDMQSEAHLIFTVIIVRLLKEPAISLNKALQELSQLKIQFDEIRNAGYLKKRYAKEAAILQVTLDKAPFFRADSSVDLLRARQKISAELTKALGEFRDFNGGILLKQEESLAQLRKALTPLSTAQELVLENYFYSLRPGIMQTVHEATTLTRHFSLFQELSCVEWATRPYLFCSASTEKYFLCFVKAMAPSFKEAVMDKVNSLQLSSYDLTTSSLQWEQASFLGFILRMEKEGSEKELEKVIHEGLQQWEREFLCALRPPILGNREHYAFT